MTSHLADSIALFQSAADAWGRSSKRTDLPPTVQGHLAAAADALAAAAIATEEYLAKGEEPYAGKHRDYSLDGDALSRYRDDAVAIHGTTYWGTHGTGVVIAEPAGMAVVADHVQARKSGSRLAIQAVVQRVWGGAYA